MLPVRRLEPRPRSLSQVPALRRAHSLRARSMTHEKVLLMTQPSSFCLIAALLCSKTSRAIEQCRFLMPVAQLAAMSRGKLKAMDRAIAAVEAAERQGQKSPARKN